MSKTIEDLLAEYAEDNQAQETEAQETEAQETEAQETEAQEDKQAPARESLAPLDLSVTEADIESVNLSSSGVLCELSIGQWGNRKQDRKATEEVARSGGAKATMLSVNKRLVQSQTLKQISALAAAVRVAVHYRLTLPWGDNGWRYLPTANFQQYEQQMSENEQQFYEYVEQFCDEYDVLRHDARESLGSYFDANVYPTVGTLRRKFRFQYNYMPVPERGDFRVDLEKEQQKHLAEQYNKFYAQQVERAVTERWEQLREDVLWMIDRFTDNEKGGARRFHASTLNDKLHFIDLLDTFNLTNDPDLTKAAAELREATRNLDADALRGNDALRRDTKERLKQVLDSLPSIH